MTQFTKITTKNHEKKKEEKNHEKKVEEKSRKQVKKSRPNSKKS